MPGSLPVPSKGALRALRHLALGTSCTVAFSAGALTEDRRRRIHTAREVCNNAKKLRSVRQYHGDGVALKDIFEDPIITHGHDALYISRKRPKEAVARGDAEPILLNASVGTGVEKRKAPHHEQPQTNSIALPRRAKYNRPAQGLTPKRVLRGAPVSRVATSDNYSSKPKQPKGYNREHKLAHDIKQLLKPPGDDDLHSRKPNVIAAASRFCEAFEEGLTLGVSGMDQLLMNTAAELCIACTDELRFDLADKVFDIVLAQGPIDESSFYRFEPWHIILRLLGEGSDASKLKKACDLYLTRFKKEPKLSFRKGWLKIGRRLCRETYGNNMFTLTDLIYWHLDRFKGYAPNPATVYYMAALHAQGAHTTLLRTLRNVSGTAGFCQRDFDQLTNIVFSSIQANQRTDIMEETLMLILRMGRRLNLVVSSTHILSTLRTGWDNHKDISRSVSTFKALEVDLGLMLHPSSAYACMIHICVEAGHEMLARDYYDKVLMKSSPAAKPLYLTQIRGSFAYAKALKNDWLGVKSDFRELYEEGHDKDQCSRAFAPVFELFAASHTTTDTETFLVESVRDFNIELTEQSSNTLLECYLANKELDAISRWLKYFSEAGGQFSPMFFNTILKNCYDKLKFSSDQILGLYFAVVKSKGVQCFETLSRRFIDNETLSILRHTAVAKAGDDTKSALKRLNHLDTMIKMPSNYQKSCTEEMAEALCSGDPSRAIRIYLQSTQAGLPLHRYCLSIAVKASLMLDPHDIGKAISLLQEGKRNNQDVQGALHQIFVHQLGELCSLQQVKEITQRTILVLERTGIVPGNQFINYPMSAMVRRSQYRDALSFWQYMSRRQNKSQLIPRIEDLNVHLQAYIGLRDPHGVDSVLEMVSINNLDIDSKFRNTLKNACRVEKKLLRQHGRDPWGPEGHWLRHITSTMDKIKEVRQDDIHKKKAAWRKVVSILQKAVALSERHTESKTSSQRLDPDKPLLYQDFENHPLLDLTIDEWV
ncbi:hypothetical protein B0O99DRAFT_607085 [Bisporella sp. PMI_857]|nr:hypothetical protein B0O99DRAFT_607085 [Bisporella sp. PMI_857]